MATVRVVHNKDRPYVVIDKKVIEDPYLSWEAKGLHAYLLSRPDNWKVSVIHLSRIYQGNKKGGGEKAILSILNELIEQGYCQRFQPRKKGGLFLRTEYQMFEFKNTLPQPDEGVADEGVAEEVPTNNTRDIISNEKEQQQTNETSNEQFQEKKPSAVVVSSKSKISEKKLSVSPYKTLRPLPKYSKPENPKEVVPIVESLYKLNIIDSLKIELSQKYTKEEIDLGVKRVLAWKTRESDSKAIRDVLKKRDSWDDSTSDNICLVEDNKLYLQSLKRLDSTSINSVYISINREYDSIQFSGGQGGKIYKITEKDFRENVDEYLKKLQDFQKGRRK